MSHAFSPGELPPLSLAAPSMNARSTLGNAYYAKPLDLAGHGARRRRFRPALRGATRALDLLTT
eukprot:14378406-Heterocapsa_arctica.AAC.1